MPSEFKFAILTPGETVYEGTICSLVAPGMEGSFGVWANHAPLLARSSGGRLTIEEISKTKRVFEVGAGVTEVFQNRVIFLTQSARAV